MKLYTSARAPNPRRVAIFMAEKAISNVALEMIDLNGQQHRNAEFLAKSPLAKIPVLELDDGRMLGETRAICTYFEGLVPEPNLMGATFEERAFIEMTDRRVEFYLLGMIGNWIRHSHPGLAPLEQPQFPEFGLSQGAKMRDVARWLDQELSRHLYVAGDRFTIADITAFCAVDFARGLMKFRPADENMAHLAAWRDRIAERPSVAR